MITKIHLLFFIITAKNEVINLLTPVPSLIKNNNYRLSSEINLRQQQNYDNNNSNNISWWGRGGPPQKLYLDDGSSSSNAMISSPSSSSNDTSHKIGYEKEQIDQNSRHNTRRLSSTKFKDLYKWNTTFCKRYYTTTTNDNNNKNNCNEIIEEDPIKFLCSYNYTIKEIQQMIKTKNPSKINEIFSSFNVKKDLYPKIQFLLHALGGGVLENNKIIISNKVKEIIPLSYYTLNLEKTLAPKHAYLIHCNIKSGTKLLLQENRWNDFLNIIKKSDLAFISLCAKWYHSDNNNNNATTMIEPSLSKFQEFQRAFRRGLLSACRSNDTNDNDIVKLLLLHGANPLELDNASGISLFHWTCGTGNIQSLQYLLHSIFPNDSNDNDGSIANFIINLKSAKDGATPMHWACCGVTSDKFGSGGHLIICQYLLTIIQDTKEQQKLINAKTITGNTPFMWACWSGSLSILKLLTHYNAKNINENENNDNCTSVANVKNINGCTSAHWATSGGHLHICKYLYKEYNMNFLNIKNNNGHTPLNHAIMYGRYDIVQWIITTFVIDDDSYRNEECCTDLQLAQKLFDNCSSNDEDEKLRRKYVVDILKSVCSSCSKEII